MIGPVLSSGKSDFSLLSAADTGVPCGLGCMGGLEEPPGEPDDLPDVISLSERVREGTVGKREVAAAPDTTMGTPDSDRNFYCSVLIGPALSSRKSDFSLLSTADAGW